MKTMKTLKVTEKKPMKYSGFYLKTEAGRLEVSKEAGRRITDGGYVVILATYSYRNVTKTVVASSSELEEATTIASNWEKSFQLEEELERRIREAANELVEDVPQHVLESAEEAALAALPPVFREEHVGKQTKDEGRGYIHFYEKVDVNRTARKDSIRSRIREWMESEAAIRVGADELRREISRLQSGNLIKPPASEAEETPAPAVAPTPKNKPEEQQGFGTSLAEALGGLGKC